MLTSISPFEHLAKIHRPSPVPARNFPKLSKYPKGEYFYTDPAIGNIKIMSHSRFSHFFNLMPGANFRESIIS